MRKLPSASLRPSGLYESKGIDQSTGKRKSYYAKSEAEAVARAARSLGIEVGEEQGTLYSYYATAYLPTVAYRSENWQSQIAWAMDRYILPALGDTSLSELKRPVLQQFFNGLLRTLKPSSARRVKIVLSGVLNLAEADEAIARNPARFVRLPTGAPPDKTALTFEELGRLLAASHDLARPVVLLGGFCGGLRIGEICAVTRGHLKGGNLLVRQQALQLKGGCRIEPSLKTPQTRRDIPLPAALAEALLCCNQVSGVYVVSNTIGGYLTPNNAGRELAFAAARAKVPAISAHELRHTFISLMENVLEAPPAIVAALAGKRDRRVTSDYSHTHREQMLKWMTAYYETALCEAEKAGDKGRLRQVVS